jgi:hypothetical protein
LNNNEVKFFACLHCGYPDLGNSLKKEKCPACHGTLIALDTRQEFEEACRGFGIDPIEEWYDEYEDKSETRDSTAMQSV